MACGLVAVAVLSLGCRSRLDRLVEVLQERERAKAAAPPPRRETFRVRDPETLIVLEERTGLLDSKGRFVKDGEEWIRYPDGSPRTRRVFAGGVPAGQWLEWWKNGILRFAHDHQPGETTAMTWWHPNGMLQAAGQAQSGLRVGHWTFWDGRGRPLREGSFEAGQRSGPWVFYGPDGDWAERGTYQRGAKTEDWELRER